MLCSGLTCIGLRGSLALQATFMCSPHPTSYKHPLIHTQNEGLTVLHSPALFHHSIQGIQEVRGPGLVQVTVHKHSL